MIEVILFAFWPIVAFVCVAAYLAIGLLISYKKENEDKIGFELRQIILFWIWFFLVDLVLLIVKYIKIEVSKWRI